jgi:hypothetical protein
LRRLGPPSTPIKIRRSEADGALVAATSLNASDSERAELDPAAEGPSMERLAIDADRCHGAKALVPEPASPKVE